MMSQEEFVEAEEYDEDDEEEYEFEEEGEDGEMEEGTALQSALPHEGQYKCSITYRGAGASMHKLKPSL